MLPAPTNPITADSATRMMIPNVVPWPKVSNSIRVNETLGKNWRSMISPSASTTPPAITSRINGRLEIKPTTNPPRIVTPT